MCFFSVVMQRYTNCKQFQIFLWILFTYLVFQPVDPRCISMHNSVMRDRKTKQINVRMDDSLAKDLRLLAEELLTTPSQIVRKAVHDYLLKCKARQTKGS